MGSICEATGGVTPGGLKNKQSIGGSFLADSDGRFLRLSCQCRGGNPLDFAFPVVIRVP